MSVVETTRALLAAFANSPWRDLHVRVAGEEIFLAKPGGAANPMRDVAPPAPSTTIPITAPHVATLVGTAAAGTRIRAGETVATIELLGDLIELPAPEDGLVQPAAIAAGSLVDYGATLVSVGAA